MTDKQIIIDGVNITNCIHRATNKLCGDIDPYCRCYTGSCKDISNCYYKELKRKEQECEKLKEEMFAHFHKTGEVPALLGFTIYDIANLVKENNALNQYKKSKQASYEALQKRCNELELENRKLEAENEGLKEKIKLYKY